VLCEAAPAGIRLPLGRLKLGGNREKISAASRAVDAAMTKLVELDPKPPAESDGQVFVNGSIIRAVMKGLFPLKRWLGLSRHR
jgi:hypothetical protein